ncbi:DUF2584 domain-containing protein [Rossellomorea aquimaris]|uniref:DUF2584 domain-containing protein n=1 Tax=Rossellomorea aquimaris TaxID=189382 RepID=UPI001CD50E84|nr:DUF2584 domain-containing protein [Rossellomorea aquimaris]MCA1056811.1 DUF2584 domain-containing protein [Rossellomorea aquimaris]
MGMGLELNTLLVTKGKEIRVDDNLFQLEKEGYRLYPIHTPIEVKTTKKSPSRGYAKIEKIQWHEDKTTIFYQLISLNTTN